MNYTSRLCPGSHFHPNPRSLCKCRVISVSLTVNVRRPNRLTLSDCVISCTCCRAAAECAAAYDPWASISTPPTGQIKGHSLPICPSATDAPVSPVGLFKLLPDAMKTGTRVFPVGLLRGDLPPVFPLPKELKKNWKKTKTILFYNIVLRHVKINTFECILKKGTFLIFNFALSRH